MLCVLWEMMLVSGYDDVVFYFTGGGYRGDDDSRRVNYFGVFVCD